MNPTPPTAAYPPARRNDGVDLDLVRRVATGDELALGMLYDRWCDVVRAFVGRILRDPDDADDIVEEVFWQVWRQAAQYDSARASVQTWLGTIARTRALDRVRALGRRREDSLDGSGDDGARTAADTVVADSDPASDVERSEQRRIVLTALADLPAEQRSVMELAYYGGFSQSEISERARLPLGTVKTRMRLALRKLRESLDVLKDGAP